MGQKQATRTVLLCVVGFLPACRATSQTGSRLQHSPNSWPAQMAGRSLQVVSDDYALYANDAGGAELLASWLDSQIVEFHKQFEDTNRAAGVVVAIEPGEEPMTALTAWRDHNDTPTQRIEWPSPNSRFGSFTGERRPYCFDRIPYFRESFGMSSDDAIELGMLQSGVEQPVWICFLATDGHFWDALATKQAQINEGRNRRIHELLSNAEAWPAILLSAPALPLMFAMAGFIHVSWTQIDHSLMELQRREILWEALIDSRLNNKLAAQLELKGLRQDIDEEWRRRWFNRPMD
ncbi:MAG: hypothetical protein IID37_13995 [Planctomycetes bacterium]|nr:hypothetical protein [Planctomycetota bacterium]